MRWKYFVGSCILGGGLLLKFGAPLVPVVLGMALAGVLNWWNHRGGPSKLNRPGASLI
jgi:hypothetical protein